MKTPEQWLASKTHCVNRNVITDRFKTKDIADIQSDAQEGMVPAAQLREVLSELKQAWQSSEHVDFSDHMHKAQDKLETLLGEKGAQ